MLSWDTTKGIGPARRQALLEAGFSTPETLAERLPRAYRDATAPVPVASLRPGMEAAFRAAIEPQARVVRAGGRVYVTAKVRDGSGAIRCTWFSAPWMVKNLPTGATLLFYGRVTARKDGAPLAVNPAIMDEATILPVYAPVEKLPAKTLRRCILLALDAGRFDDALPETFRARYGLCPRQLALRQAHFPESREALESARRRLAFEELVLFQSHLYALRRRTPVGAVIPSTEADADAFWAALPFSPTAAQRAALEDVRRDLAAPGPMARLVQGDVGCGKTAIALGALVLAVRAGFQGALMAPTEALAAQHYRTALRLLEPLGIRCALLTGKLSAPARRDAREAAATGMARVIIGTHALLSEDVAYQNLGLAVTDEQHRFGVRQRGALAGKAAVAPNVLVLSATPIPRTLSLVLFGDLDVSVVGELPPGRTPVRTRRVPEAKRAGLYAFLRAQVSAGRQAYVICPLVDENEALDCPSAAETFRELSDGPLAGLRVGLAHGKLPPRQLAQTLLDFAEHRLDVLVATTVVEVGVDVPNATVMVVENADRFGLSQLHQLRGRVGRGEAESFCFLTGPSTDRVEALLSTNDGFVIAQRDLELRGPGEWFGTRQHGAPELPGARLGADVRLLEETQTAVRRLFSDPARAHEAALVRDAAARRFAAEIDEMGRN